MGPLYGAGMRRFVMSSFPYSIIYHVDEQKIDIYAVAHAKRSTSLLEESPLPIK
jgi:hypothetical protein